MVWVEATDLPQRRFPNRSSFRGDLGTHPNTTGKDASVAAITQPVPVEMLGRIGHRR